MNLNSISLIVMLVLFTYNTQISIGGVITSTDNTSDVINANSTVHVPNNADINDNDKKDEQNNMPIAQAVSLRGKELPKTFVGYPTNS